MVSACLVRGKYKNKCENIAVFFPAMGDFSMLEDFLTIENNECALTIMLKTRDGISEDLFWNIENRYQLQ